MVRTATEREGNLFVPARRKQGEPPAGLKLRPNLFERNFFRQQIVGGYAEDFCQKQQFAIGNAAQLRFKFPNRAKTDAPALQLQLLRKHGLRPAFQAAEFPHLRANDVEGKLHPLAMLLNR